MAQYQLSILSNTGTVIELLSVPESLPFAMEWSRRLNGVGTCTFSVLENHWLAQNLLDYLLWNPLLISRNGVPVWAGLILKRERLFEAEKGWQVRFTAYTFEVLLSFRYVQYGESIDGKTVFNNETLVNIFKALINDNLGATATVANGRFLAGTVVWPSTILFDTSGNDTVTQFEVSRDQNILDNVLELCGIHDYAFVSDYGDTGFTFHFGERPLGVDRTLANADYRLLSPNNETLINVHEVLDVSLAPTHVTIVPQDLGDGISNSVNTGVGTPVLSKLDDTLYQARIVEYLGTQSQNDTTPAIEGQFVLNDGQREAFKVSLEINNAVLEYGRDINLGDRFRVEVWDREYVDAELIKVDVIFSETRGEVIRATVSVPRSGVYGV